MRFLTVYFFLVVCLCVFFTFNYSPSMSVGLYMVTPFLPKERGTVVRFFKEGHFLLKYIVGLPGDYVVIDGEGYWVNGIFQGKKEQGQFHGAPLEDFRFDGVVPAGKVFVWGLGRSWDSRYWGPVGIQEVSVYIKIL